MGRIFVVLTVSVSFLISLQVKAAELLPPTITSVHPYKVFNNNNKIFIDGDNYIGADIKKLYLKKTGNDNGLWEEYKVSSYGSKNALFPVPPQVEQGTYDLKIFSSKSNAESNVIENAIQVFPAGSCILPMYLLQPAPNN